MSGQAVTIRWFLSEEVMTAKFPKIHLMGHKHALPFCKFCHKKPPEVFQFMVLSESLYCHDCLKKSIEEVESVDSLASQAQSLSEDRK